MEHFAIPIGIFEYNKSKYKGKDLLIKMYQRIRDLREDADKTQKQIADEMFMHVSQYRRYESGEREVPFSFAIALSKYYNVSLDYIAGLTNEKCCINTNDITENDLKLFMRFKSLSDMQKGRILERMDIIENDI